MTTHEQRKSIADEKAGASYYFSYVLQLDDGSFYIGSTNAPFARWTEHAVSKGAKATDGKQFRVRMAIPFLTRREAEYNEQRLTNALRNGIQHIEALLTAFDQMVNVVRPEKTFSQLQREEAEYLREMERVFHHSTALSFNLGPRPGTACGYNGPSFYSTNDWEQIKKMARDEDFTGNIYGRKVCRRCLELAPQE